MAYDYGTIHRRMYTVVRRKDYTMLNKDNDICDESVTFIEFKTCANKRLQILRGCSFYWEEDRYTIN